MKKSNNKEKGQVLVFALLSMVIITIGVIFLFDMQSVIRSKIKGQTAVDAAALAGANWQKHTLNLIGELNLMKACTVLVTDVPPMGDDTEEGITASSDLLTEMQTRVSFVGPLIGFGAAEAAAKNNGLNYNEYYGLVVQNHLERLEDDDFYGSGVISQIINNYEWRDPYIEMLRMVYDSGKGIAVGVNTNFQGMPHLTSDPPDFIGYLQRKWVYTAIHANDWCRLKELLRMDYSSQKWWGDIELIIDSASFPQESEYLTVGIDFFSGEYPYTEAYDRNVLQPLTSERGMTNLSDAYDAYDPGEPGDTDSKINPLPYITWAIYDDNVWYAYLQDTIDTWTEYLRAPIQSKYTYYGAVTRARTEIEPQTLTGKWSEDKYLGDKDTLGFYDKYDYSTGENRLKEAEKRMKTDLDTIKTTALAKPLGSLPGVDAIPNYVSMVLPVFSKATLIPVSLEDPGGFDPFDYKWYAFLTEYLPMLGTTDNLEDMQELIENSEYADHWSWFVYYHNALLKLNDPDWREQGLEWLDTPILDAEGEPILNPDGTTMTNEDNCNYWPPGGEGGRRGPDVLH